jgi:hypothetical protein
MVPATVRVIPHNGGWRSEIRHLVNGELLFVLDTGGRPSHDRASVEQRATKIEELLHRRDFGALSPIVCAMPVFDPAGRWRSEVRNQNTGDLIVEVDDGSEIGHEQDWVISRAEALADTLRCRSRILPVLRGGLG